MHVFEPASFCFKQSSESLHDQARVHLKQCAVSSVGGSSVLFYDRPGSQLASLTLRPRFENAQSETVRLETLDEYCKANHVTSIDLLKLDVEGNKLEALKGCS